MSILTGLKADKSDLQRLKVAFKMFDKNNDGSLSPEEIKESEDQLENFGLGGEWGEIMKKVDLDGDG